jgi:hypothetical protein
LIIEINSVLGLLHLVDIGVVAFVSEIHADRISDAEDAGIVHPQSVISMAPYTRCNNPRTEITPMNTK